MINSISKIQKIASGNKSAIMLNTSLPVSIKVMEKTGFNRYNLKFANKTLSTKSVKPLKIGAHYWGEISLASENIVIKNLYEKPDLKAHGTLTDGLNIIEKLIVNNDLNWFYEYIFSNLASCETKEGYEIYVNMLFALQKNIIHIPFFYNEHLGIFQMKKDNEKAQIYLIFSNFAPLFFNIKNSQILNITTPFEKVARFLKEKFECDVNIGVFSEIYTQNSSIVDFKG